MNVSSAQPAPAGHKHLVPAAYGAVHAIVDATTVFVTFAAILVHDLDPSQAWTLVLAYDLLAFASQFAFGLLTDRLRIPRATAAAGVVFAALGALLLPVDAVLAMVLVGVGNALFHVGAGAISLYVEPGRATAPGIFVAPGALGLALGLFLGKAGGIPAWPFLIALVAGALVLWRVRAPRIPYDAPPAPVAVRGLALVVILLLASIAVRSFVGFAGSFDVPRDATLSIGIAVAAFAGKGLGGILSDRLGWIEISVGALVVSAPLIAFADVYPPLLWVGMLLFQMTMPVTLVALTMLFPRRPAFIFGLACLALILGAVPTFYRSVQAYYSDPGLLGLIVLSAGALYVALRRFGGAIPSGRRGAGHVAERAANPQRA